MVVSLGEYGRGQRACDIGKSRCKEEHRSVCVCGEKGRERQDDKEENREIAQQGNALQM